MDNVNKKQEQQKGQSQPKIEVIDKRIFFSELISKITVTRDTPTGLLADWGKEYDIRNCQVVLK